jgi:oligopeptide transport system substrate-binding protein
MRLFETPYTMVVYKPLYEASRIETGGSSYGTSAETFMSAGPMILTKWEKDALYCFDRNPDYIYADRYSIDGVDVSVVPDSNTATELFLSGQLDYLSISYSQWESFEDDPRVYDFWGNSLQYMFVNLGNPNQQNLLGDIDFRRALYYGAERTSMSAALGAIPATRLVRKAVVGDPATGTAFVELEGAGDYIDDGYTVYDPNIAKEYLDRALEKRGIDQAHMEIYYGESATHSRAASEILHAQYSDLFSGKLKVTLRSVPAAMQYNLRRYNPDDPTAFDTSIGSITPSADAPHYTFQYYVSSYSPPRFCYSNAEYDRLYAEAVSESDPLKSARICMQLEQILLSDLVIIPLYELPSKALFSNRIKLPSDGFINNFGFGYEFGVITD